MPDKETVLKLALEAGIRVLEEQYGKDYSRSMVTDNIAMLVEAMWPYLDSYQEMHVVKTFEAKFHERFPNHVLADYGPSVFEYVVGNTQTAVVNEILCMMEDWLTTMHGAQEIPKFQRTSIPRDWDVATAHIKELMSEVRQYRARGGKGHPQTHTGNLPIQD